MNKYSWSIDIYKADADAVGHEIETLGDNCTPSQVVEIARNKNSAMHNLFEWDDTKAAEKYRTSQAQKILRTLTVQVVPIGGSEVIQVRAFVCPVEGRSTYTKIAVVMENDGLYNSLLEQARKELQALRNKYAKISSEDFRAIVIGIK